MIHQIKISPKIKSSPVYCVPRPVSPRAYRMSPRKVTSRPEVPTVYSNSKTYRVGNLVKFKGWIYEMVEAAGAPGYAPDRSGDKLWKMKAQDLDFLRAKKTSEESERAKRAKEARDRAAAAARKAAEDLANALTDAERKRALAAKEKAERELRLAKEAKLRADRELSLAKAYRLRREREAKLAAEKARLAREARERAEEAARRARRAREEKDRADAASRKAAQDLANARSAAEKARALEAARLAEEARKKAEEALRLAREAKMRADSEAAAALAKKRKAENDARLARLAAEEARRAREAKQRADDDARRAKEEARRAKEAKARADAAARKAAEDLANARSAEEKARAEEAKRRADAERAAAEERLRLAREAKMKAEADARIARERKQRADEAERRAREEADRKAREERERKAREEAIRKAKEDALKNASNTINKFDGLRLWIDASNFKGQDNKKIQKWNNLARDSNISFKNDSGNRDTYPIVIDNVLNKLPVLEFKTFQNMEVNGNLRSEDYTMIFLARQIGGTNRRLLIGNGNRLLGYWNGGKDQLYMEGWLSTPGSPPSNKDWDLYTIRRSRGKTFMSRFGETITSEVATGQGFDGLYVNKGGCCGGETSDGQIAEIAVWDRALNPEDMAVVQGYMAWKWGLQGELSENHPNANKPTELNSNVMSVPQTLTLPKTELNLIDGLKVWFDTSKITQTGSIGELVSSAVSRKPNAFVSNTNDSGRFPVVKQKALNGMPVLQFNTNQVFSLKKNIKYNEFTMIFLTRQLGGNNRRFLIGNGNRLYGYWNGGKDQLYMEGWLNGSPGGPPSNSEWDIYVIKREADGRTFMHRNGESKMIANGGRAANLDGIHLNNGGCCGGETSDAQFAELAVWNRVLSESEIKKAEAYMAWKWGLQGELPENHEYANKATDLNTITGGAVLVPKIKDQLNLVDGIKFWFDTSKLTPGTVSELKSNAVSRKPMLLVNNTTDQSRLPVVKMDGLNKLPVLEFNTNQSLRLNKSMKSNEFTMVFLTRQLGRTNRRFVIGDGNRLYGYWNGGKDQLFMEGWLCNTPGGPPSNSEWDIYVIRREANGKTYMHRNGDSQMVANGGTAAAFDGLFLNTGGCCGGETSDAQFAEIAFWNRALNPDEVKKVEAYVAWKWGLQGEFPDNHPYANKPSELNVGIVAPPETIVIKQKLNTIDGIKLWFDASTLTSGSVNELVSATGGRKPYKFINRSNNSARLPVVKAGELNKLSVLEFNTDQSLSLNKSLKANEFTMVFLTRQLGGNRRRFVIGDGNRLFGYWNGGKNQLYMEGWLCATPGGPPSTKDWDLYVIRRESNGRTYMTRNGESKLIANGGVAAAFDGLHLNTGGCCGGETSDAQFAELAFWNRSLNDVEIKKIEGYMAWKWGLQGELAENHPFANSPTEWNTGVVATPDSATDPTANRVVWLDSSDQSTLVLSGSKLLQWKDKSGNGNNFSTQEGFQPEVDDDKTIKFNRSFMYSEKPATYPLDAYIVIKLGDLNHNDVLGISPAGRDDFNSLTFGEHTRGRWHNGSSGFGRTGSAVSTENETNTDKFMLIQYTLKNGKYSIRRNGNVIMQTNVYSYNMPNDAIYNLGCRVGYQIQKGMRHVMLNGNIAEMIVYNRPLKSAERKGIEDRLTQKWITNQPKAIIPVGGFEYQGCYNDSHNRAITRYVGNVGSAKECEKKAKDAGATVFGLQYYGQCFIGKEGVDSSFAKYGKRAGACPPMGSDWNNQVYLRK